MSAIRPQPPPGQERREETLAQAKATQVLLSPPRFPFVLAVFYIALLIVPWVLTCKIASQPSWIIQVWRWDTRYNFQYGWLIAINVLNSLATVLSLPILSALLARAAVVFSQRRKPGQTLSLRQLFALADRDWYNFFRVLSPVASSAFLRLGFLVLFIAALLPLIRSGLVAYDNVLVTDNLPKSYARSNREMLGYTPSPLAVKSGYENYQDEVLAETRKSLLTTVGGIEPKLWPVCNDESSDSTCGFKYGPYDLGQSSLSNFWEGPGSYGSDRDFQTNGSALMFASTLWAGASIGSYYENDFGAYTLGLKSGARCETISSQELGEQCLRSLEDWSLPNAARGWNTSMEIEGELRVDICYPALERSPWEAADASPWKPINFAEHLYIGISDEDSFWECPSWDIDCEYGGSYEGLFVHCQADSAMSFFEIGSAKTKGVPTRFLDELPSGFDIPRRRDRPGAPSTSPEDVGPDFIGPLKTAALAMFGNGSWLDTLNLVYPGVVADNTTIAGALAGLCQMLPLGNIDVFGRHEYCETIESVGRNPGWYSPSIVLSSLTRDFFWSFYTPKLARATLNTATFYANQALLSQMAGRAGSDSREYKRGTEQTSQLMTVPVLSVPAIAIVSILIAMQVVCIVILLAYIYSSRVWTRTLDALAVARVGAQLSALDVFLVPRETGTLGTARLSPRAAKQLDQVDGLVGSTALTGHRDVEMATVPPPYAPRGEEPSTREEQSVPRPGAAAAARDTAPQQDHPPVPSYSPPADGHTTRAADGAVDSAGGGRGEASDMDISHAAPGESQGTVLPAVTSVDAVAVGGRGLITRRMWRQADKPLSAPPAEQ